MEEIVLKEEFQLILENMIMNNHIQNNISWYYYELARYFDCRAIKYDDFIDVFPKLMALKLKEHYDLTNKKCFVTITYSNNIKIDKLECQKAKAIIKKYFNDCEVYDMFDNINVNQYDETVLLLNNIQNILNSDIIIQIGSTNEDKRTIVENTVASLYNKNIIDYKNLSKFLI